LDASDIPIGDAEYLDHHSDGEADGD